MISPSAVTGRKKSRCRTVWVSTQAAYTTRDARAAKASWLGENWGPGVVVVKFGSTRLSVARVATVASPAPLPSALKTARCRRMAPSSKQMPTIPLQVIMTAAKTVSRANEAYSGLPELIKVTIRPTSITVTATAKQQRAERFADPVGDHLGVVDRTHHGRGQDHRHQHHHARCPGCGPR